MVIKELKNPITEKYSEFKNIIFSDYFPWFATKTTPGKNGVFFNGHVILKKPEVNTPVSMISSKYFDLAVEVLLEIFEHNNLHLNYFLRINVNMSHNYGGGIASDIHQDHSFPHKNLLIYLNQSGGPIVVINSQDKTEEYFYPKEDAIITFGGESHYIYQPNVGERRVVLVATYF